MITGSLCYFIKMSSKIASVCLLVAVAISTASATIPLPSVTLAGVPQIGVGLPTLPAGGLAAALPAVSVSLPTAGLPAFSLGAALPALPAIPSLAIPGITAAIGGTAVVASGGSVALAAAAIAGLAIAKEALILATIKDSQRRKRAADEGIDFSKVFDRIAEQDVADCGKLLVCQSFAKPEGQRSGEENAVVNLFDDLSAIQNNAYGTYQWAAYSGSFKNPVICIERYGKCPVEQSILSNLVAPAQ